MEQRPIAFVLAATAHGLMIVPRNDRVEVEGGAYGVGGQLLALGSYAQQEVDQIKALLSLRRERFGDDVVMLDVGANIGVMTIDCARHMYDWGTVVAFEPQERLFQAMCGNLVINNLRNAHAFILALGNEDRMISVPIPDYDSSGSYGSLELKGRNEDLGQEIAGDTPHHYVSVVPLDIFCSRQKIDRIDFIKIDVEGMELDVLAGAEKTIRRCQPILWVEQVKNDRSALHVALDDLGYQAFPAGMNLLCVPKDADYVREGEDPKAVPRAEAEELDAARLLGEVGNTTEAMVKVMQTRAYQDPCHPLHDVALMNLGTLKMQEGFMGEAIQYYNEVIAHGNQAYADLALFGRGFANLVIGNLRLGFEGFEHRKMGDVPPALKGIPRLRPQDVRPTEEIVKGKTILVLGEMGFGDNIMFARYLRMLVEQGAHVVAAVPPSLKPLFSCLGGIQVHGEHSPVSDMWVPMMSLAYIFRTNIDSVPPPADFELRDTKVAKWKAPMLIHSTAGRLRVGLCWSGSRKSQYDAHRSVPFQQLAPLFQVSGVDFYSLQMDVREGDRAAYDESNIFGMADQFHTFEDTACAIRNLDLVITVDTSVAHLAGSIGVPTWVMLTAFRTYWLWIQGRSDCPWYPTAKAYRQEKHGEWGQVIEQIAADLKTFSVDRLVQGNPSADMQATS